MMTSTEDPNPWEMCSPAGAFYRMLTAHARAGHLNGVPVAIIDDEGDIHVDDSINIPTVRDVVRHRFKHMHSVRCTHRITDLETIGGVGDEYIRIRILPALQPKDGSGVRIAAVYQESDRGTSLEVYMYVPHREHILSTVSLEYIIQAYAGHAGCNALLQTLPDSARVCRLDRLGKYVSKDVFFRRGSSKMERLHM